MHSGETDSKTVTIFADRRWPVETGIGKVQTELEARLPANMRIVDIGVGGRIGSPLSPLAISGALMGRGSRGVFYSAGFVPPVFSRLPSVVIVHDLTHRRFYGAAKRAYYDLVYKPLYRRCSAVICVSEFTRQEFLEWSGMPAEKVHLVYNGYESCFNEAGPVHQPGYPYVFYGGNHRSYKNLDRLIKAFAASTLPSRGIKLVLTGKRNDELATLADNLSVGSDVVFAGRLPSEEIPSFYRGALAVAYVSLFEGFGLPIVEAYACGVPVLTSNVSAMPEVAGEGALLVNPESVEEIKQGLDRITSDEDLRMRLIAGGRRRREDFDWDSSAQRLWQLVKDTAA
ncbi:glycosyltransferase family 1 protein [Ciceribacter sp. L1K22]|uniref:glycosyltransferase family 4 protein n=1 Tax=Ciceribacter sp. L1K22 TaxID=2820275 RepID=UPI001ABDA4F2|nr:glycosyltransferase family 4 protein [Ciceribacter sp. L1K22]